MAHHALHSRGVYRFVGLLLSSLFIGAEAGAPKNCSVVPTAIPFTNVTVLFAPDRSAAHRSMAWVAGSQNVPLGMQVGTTLNSSFMPESSVCTANIDRGCVFWRGGIFDLDSSTTWVPEDRTQEYNASRRNAGWDYLNEADYAGSDPISAFPRGWDDFQIQLYNGDKLKLDGYPMVAIDNGSFPFGQGMIGLASDSSFLEVLVERSQSPSRSWSLDYGLSAAENSVAGELVIGGYNRQKAAGDDFEKFEVFKDKSKPCPLQVQVNKINWGTADLMENQEPFMACVEPAYWTTIMPRTVRQNFNRTMLSGGNVSFVSSTWEYILYNNSDPTQLPTGDVYMELDGGFNITIPRSEWIFPSAFVNLTEGRWNTIPDQIQTTIGNAGFPDSVEPKLPFLGAPFLSQVYLRVDYESNEFGLAHIKRDDPVVNPSLVRLGCDDYDGPDGGSIISPTPTATAQPSSSGGSNTGAIAGGVVGGLAGLAVIGIAALCFIRRRKQAAAAAVAAPVDNTAGPGVVYDQNKDQTNMAQYNPQNYEDPPAFSPTATPAPYSPVGSPVYYAGGGVQRRPLPGQQYPGYYDNPGGYTEQAAELGGSDIVAASELSGRPRSTGFGQFAEGNMDDPAMGAGKR
ncbi:aspartic peptidase domain-containing protein [Morchella snyderi]|nr:aspartic peptidase domain-containing protein [Morchella snyderi]